MKARITKKPKPVVVTYNAVKSYVAYIPEYLCPSCKTIFRGCGPHTNTTRFICSCGQELSVNSRIFNDKESI